MFIRSRRNVVPSRLLVASAFCVTAALLSSCMARPSDAPTVDGQPGDAVQQDDTADQAKKMREVTVGVDEFVEGFNPHLLADISPVTSLVARLTLPSAFVPAPLAGKSASMSAGQAGSETALEAESGSAESGSTAGTGWGRSGLRVLGPTGASAEIKWQVNSELLESVQVIDDKARLDTESSPSEHGKSVDSAATSESATSESAVSVPGSTAEPAETPQPLGSSEPAPEADTADTGRVENVSVTNPAVAVSHVRYRIREGAQWSDGTPISGEDFRYLHQQITSAPGTQDEAAYELIESIDVSDGGHQVDVKFSQPLTHWQRLFSNLLPAHLMRTNADGFLEALASHFPASGGQYSVDSIDVGRNIIRLVRNDRYWGTAPATSEVITLRAVRSAVDGAEQLRSAQIQAAQVRPQETDELTYGLVPGVSEFSHEPGRELVFTVNLGSSRLSDVSVRRQILATINAGQVAEVATGRRIGANSSASVSTAAQIVRQSVFTDEDPLRIGVISSGKTAQAAANAVSDQLTAAGIPASVVPYSPTELMRTSLPYGTVDAVVAWDEQPTTILAARERYACTAGSVGSLPPHSEESTIGSSTISPSSSPTSDTSSASRPSAASRAAESTNSTTRGTAADSAPLPVAPSSAARSENLSGLCDRNVDELLRPDRVTVPAELSDVIAQHAIELTLTTDNLLTVIGPAITISGREDPAQWPRDPLLGRLGALSEVGRVNSGSSTTESSESGSSETARSDDEDRHTAPTTDNDN